MASSGDYLANILAEHDSDSDKSDGQGVGGLSCYSDGCEDFGSVSINSSQDESISDGEEESPGDGNHFSSLQHPTQNCVEIENLSFVNRSTQNPPKNHKGDIDEGSIEAHIIPKGKLIAHHVINNDCAVFCSFDLEHGGEYCGIIQVSAQLFCVNNFHANPKVEYISNAFNKYVRPSGSAIWEQNTTNIHHLSSTLPQILSANPINQVWSDFDNFINSNLHNNERCIMVAYNGEACDLRWLLIHHSDGSKTTTQECTEMRVRLRDSSRYCAQCYRNIKGDALSSKEKKTLCRKSTMGCPSCMEPICKPCWDHGYDQH